MTHILIPRTPSMNLLRPFIECPTSELDRAWAAMVRIAEVQHARVGRQCLTQIEEPAAPAAVAGPAPKGWRLVPATPTRDWIAAVADGGYEDCDCASLIADILSRAPAAPALEAPPAVAPQGEYPHEQMDAMALARYKVVPSHASMLWSHAVVAGDGAQQLYVGREVECQNMARKFAGAFLDGAFAFHSMAAAPTAQAAPALEAPAALLTKPALVGSCRFGVGVPERYVIDAAQRHHEQEGQREAMTAEQFADEERKRRTLWELIHGPLAAAPQAPAAPVGTDEVTCVCGATWERHGHCEYEMVHTPRKAAPAAPAVDAPAKGEVVVEVHGLTGSGKSAICGEIEIMCRALGLEVAWPGGESEKRMTHAEWTDALELYKPRVRIVERNHAAQAAAKGEHAA